jgi:hypothetical protein
MIVQYPPDWSGVKAEERLLPASEDSDPDLEDPALEEFLTDPALEEFLTDPALEEFLTDPALEEFLTDPALEEFLTDPTDPTDPALEEFLTDPTEEYLESLIDPTDPTDDWLTELVCDGEPLIWKGASDTVSTAPSTVLMGTLTTCPVFSNTTCT